jgi:acyl dehydratase
MTMTDVRDLTVGATHRCVLVDGLTRTQIVMYAGASGDYNPLHTDEVYATKVAGYPSVIAHGQLTMGLTARIVTGWLDDAVLTAFGARFSRQVWPGDTLTGTATVTAVGAADGRPTAELELVTTNQDGQTVITGYARVRGAAPGTGA